MEFHFPILYRTQIPKVEVKKGRSMLNYSVHAAEYLKVDMIPHVRGETKEVIREIVEHLEKGIKFELPMNGTFFEDDMSKGWDVMEPNLLRLPFPVTVLEYPYSMWNYVPENIEVPKRILVCLDYETHKKTYHGLTAGRIFPLLDEVGGIIIIPVYGRSEVKSEDLPWYPSIWGAVFPRIEYDPEGKLTPLKYGKDHSKSSKVGTIIIPVVTEMALDLMKKVGTDKALDLASQDMSEETLTVMGFLAALSCSNVQTETIPAPDALNKKRAKSGKPLFQPFRTVVINTHQDSKYTVERGPLASGRTSPKEHIRRGHIRIYGRGTEGAKRIWIL